MAEPENTKKTRGRRKIPMQRIENSDARSITFSKRRAGIYKKASDIVSLCGAEVGVLFFSPSGRPFTYGFPSIESVAGRFLRPVPETTDVQGMVTDLAARRFNRMRNRLTIDELNLQVIELEAGSEAMKKRAEAVSTERRKKEEQAADWWDFPVEDLSLEQMRIAESEMMNFSRYLERGSGSGAAGRGLAGGNCSGAGVN